MGEILGKLSHYRQPGIRLSFEEEAVFLVMKRKCSLPQMWATFTSLSMMGVAKPIIRYHET
jgi:hypothetical protein